jgi:hypothetical protein
MIKTEQGVKKRRERKRKAEERSKKSKNTDYSYHLRRSTTDIL